MGKDPIDEGYAIYHLSKDKEGESFTADYWNGSFKIKNHLEAAEFTKLNLPVTNIGFANSRLEDSFDE